jgi:cytochrome P450
MIAILGANRNPEIWGDDAYEWKPERWLSPLPDTVMAAHVPGIYSNMSVIFEHPTRSSSLIITSG